MIRSLAAKLTLAFLLVALTVAALVAITIRLTSAGQLGRLIIEQQRSDFQTELVTYYQANGSWDGVANRLYTQNGPPGPQPTAGRGDDTYGDGGHHHDFRQERRGLFGLVDASGVVVIPLMPRFPTGRQIHPAERDTGVPVTINGQVVGTILSAELPPGLTPEESAYLQRTNYALLLAGGGAVLMALLVGLLLARSLTRPLHDLTQATHRMAGGQLEQAVVVKSTDEIGELASAFNQMSRAVAQANLARRQMTADVAHELRTPLTVISGYVESMRDGVLTASPERLAVIYFEIEHLQHLVGDLRTLSQSDAGELKLQAEPVAPAELLEQAKAAFEHQAEQAGVKLEVASNGGLPAIRVDETRMAQVLNNLLSNALRHTPSGGTVRLSAAEHGDGVVLTVRDNGHGIPADEVPFIFNRFYRVDKSRSADDGASGLGLAIVKALVDAHGGSITTESSPGAGSTFSIFLPSNRISRPDGST